MRVFCKKFIVLAVLKKKRGPFHPTPYPTLPAPPNNTTLQKECDYFDLSGKGLNLPDFIPLNACWSYHAYCYYCNPPGWVKLKHKDINKLHMYSEVYM